MSVKKKTMYEILEVSPAASLAEIQSAYQRLSEKFHAEKYAAGKEDADFNLKLVNLAYHTLSTSASREAYDLQITPSLADTPAAATQNSLLPVQQSSYSTNLKADALALKADALSLRADALLMRANGLPPNLDVHNDSMTQADAASMRAQALMLRAENYPVQAEGPLAEIKDKFSGLAGPLKRVLIGLGTFVAVIMILMVVMSLFGKRPDVNNAEIEDQLRLQEYYQTHGVRPASITELNLLEAEERRQTAENNRIANERRESEQSAEKSQREYERFVEESRRIGESVSHDLERAAEREEEKARYEAERQQQREEQVKQREEEAEQRRLAAEREKWDKINSKVQYQYPIK